MKKNYSLNLIKCFSFCFFCVVLDISAQNYDFTTLRNRVVTDQRINILGTSTITNWVTTQRTDGSWSDVPYGNNISSTNTNNHLYRLWHIAAACSKVGHEKYNDTSYKEAVKKGLQFWYSSNTKDTNWWYNEIFFPQNLGEILIFMREFDGFIPKTASVGIDEPEILGLFKPTAISSITYMGTGANAIDIALHYVYRGLLTENGTLLMDTKNELESVLIDNIKGDLMYHDHGPQIMTASYGWVFCDGLVRLASFLAGSPAAFNVNSGNFNTVLSFIRNTQASSIRGRYWDFGVMGRSVSRENGLNANLNYMRNLASYIDPSNASEYNDILSRLNGTNAPSYKVKEFNKHFWASDYMLHSRSGYLFTVRNTSTRTVEAEKGNGENLKANYLSYGANFFAIDGDEYTNIMPIWDWSMIPGTTFPYITTFPSRSDWGVNFGSTTFVGGVSDGVYGSSVLDQNKNGIKAKKSWFFFDNEIVCLGAGIIDNSNRNVRTTINQAWLKENSFISETGSTSETLQSVSGTTYTNSNLKYIRNGKFGYYFPNQGNVKFSMKSQSGTWQSINTTGSSTSQSGFVFSLWIDHGTNPNNGNYSYIVVPGIDSAQKAQSYDASVLNILENSASKQAVYHTSLDILQVVFYQAGTVSWGAKSITVDKPCSLLVKNGSLVTVSNPSQNSISVQVTLTVNDIPYLKSIQLPTNSDVSGASVSVDFSDALAVSDFSNIKLNTFIYPNPTKGILNLKSDSVDLLTYKVNGMDGKNVASGKFTRETNINLSNCANGMYFLIVTNEKKQLTTQKIIKY